nr:MAG TPA: Single strand binding protein [Caudoviricetes sp.]
MSINRVNITGNLTRDPELRATAGGTQMLAFGVAVNDRRKNPQTSAWEDVPNFVDCIVFGSRAEAVSRFISKGSKVAIEGKLRYSAWETKEGQRRSKLEVIVDEIEFMSRSNGQQVTSPAAEAAKVADTPAYGMPQAPEPEFYDADIPF